MLKIINKILGKFNFRVSKISLDKNLPTDFENIHTEIINLVTPYTMTSNERLYGLINAVKYIEENKIEGDIVECGVWKGGSMMAVASMLKHLNNESRKLFLYDTFEGMVTPGVEDIDMNGKSASSFLNDYTDKSGVLKWCYSTVDEVKENLKKINYKKDNLYFIQGKVEETIPNENMPKRIALLRLDTDWYSSTKHEMEHLFPLLEKNGIFIIDDYGHWEGAKKAIDEYFQNKKIFPFLGRLDETGRVYINQ